jgi:ubiquinone/menaquinone biosynthesis C-methylase UbiE
MTDTGTRKKWDSAGGLYDVIGAYGPENRWAPFKSRLFSRMEGNILFLAVGTGLDIASFPLDKEIIGIDISPKMLARAAPRAAAYPGNLALQVMDVHEMEFPDASFDQIYTSCTFCSVPDPVKGLSALRRVLKPGGYLGMFEHTGSRCFPFNAMLNLMNPVARHIGPEINRDTVSNVREAGFEITKVTNIFLDVVKTIEATAPE